MAGWKRTRAQRSNVIQCTGLVIRVLAGDEDAHLDAPQLLDLLSEKPVEGANRAPKQQDTAVPMPSRGPVQWAFAL
ncbi:hypothetical protein CY34DRAFT_807787 [Suillus luteus UH-Slu-Lm8-n1]|uniref:Uncharacterized protein n=1 Tax=Suillus luteus UH-Slu-Lm8-n1 TaxID=930992 RepID=A0A0D0AZT5_9AGAM|nr:hypothetical protein CY34DRAFT_807787 [Suillus luteus UH-Slu-Lm8-n1]